MAMVEAFAMSWAYGVNNFCRDIEFMSLHEEDSKGNKKMQIRTVGWYWKICWPFLVPFGLLVIFVYAMVTEEGKNLPSSAIGKNKVKESFCTL